MWRAVRIDPTNATAKYDLEGLLYLYSPLSNGEPPQLIRRKGTGPDSGAGGAPGASQNAGGF